MRKYCGNTAFIVVLRISDPELRGNPVRCSDVPMPELPPQL